MFRAYGYLSLASMCLIVLFASCGASGGFFSGDQGAYLFEVSLSASAPRSSIAEASDGSGLLPSASPSSHAPLLGGGVLAPNSVIEAACRPLSGSPVVDEIQLGIIRGGQVIAQALFAVDSGDVSSLLGAALPLALPASAEPGLYAFSVEIRSKAELLYQSTTEFFVLSEPFRIESVQVCPARVEPSRIAVLEARLSFQKGLDPWLVWSRNGKTLSAGLLSSGAGQLLWTSPADEGIHGISLSAWPEGPSDGLAFSYAPVSAFHASVVVAADPPDPLDPLSHRGDFHALFRFEGSFAESTGLLTPSALSVFGIPVVKVYGPGYGYAMGPSDGVVSSLSILPSVEGRLAPLSLILRFQPEADASGSLIRFRDGALSLVLAVEDGELVLQCSRGKDSLRSSSGIAAGGRFLDLCLSLEPWQNGLQATWFLDDRQVSSTFLPLDTGELGGEGGFSIGGEGSCPAVYDDFGVYSRRLPDGKRDLWSRSFEAESSRRAPGALVFAEGFDSTFMPAGLGVSGAVSKVPGALILDKGSSLSIALDEGWKDGLRVEASAFSVSDSTDSASPEPAFSLSTAAGTALTIHADGRVLRADGRVAAILPVQQFDAMAFSISRSGTALRLGVGKAFVNIDLDLPDSGLVLGFGTSMAPLGLSSLRAFHSSILDALSAAPPPLQIHGRSGIGG